MDGASNEDESVSERPLDEHPNEGDLERDAYLEERKVLVEAEGEASQSLDKALITLSAGAFGLSLLFISRIAPEPKALWWLYTAWGGFIMSLVSILLSFLASQKAFRSALELLDDLYKGTSSATPGNHWSTMTSRLTITSIVSFVCGVIALAVFATRNLT